ncbi:hypothetical protein YC2023_005488 [Brassica napus]
MFSDISYILSPEVERFFTQIITRYGLEFSFGDSLAQERFHHQWVLASLWICEEAVDFVARGWSWLLRFRELFSGLSGVGDIQLPLFHIQACSGGSVYLRGGSWKNYSKSKPEPTLFDRGKDYMKHQTRFISNKPANVVLSSMEVVLQSMGALRSTFKIIK